MNCRHCKVALTLPLINLGSAPPSNAYLSEETLRCPEKWFPLRVLVCQECWLVQVDHFADAHELFNAEYSYFSSFSSTWLTHCEQYVSDMVARWGLTKGSHVVEVAANDGYLLQFVKARGIPCMGVEPTRATAAAARAKGLSIVEEFFTRRLAQELSKHGMQADLLTANNVLAHVPDINDFVAGIRELLKKQGVATFEFPHLLKLIEENQFDTIYHEHFSYFSLTALERVFGSQGLQVFDVEELATHGGSLRVFAQRVDSGKNPRTKRVKELLAREMQAGITSVAYYDGFQARADRLKDNFVLFLLKAKRQSKLVAAYGAAAKGNTLMNYAGIKSDLISFVADRNPDKQGKWMPGSRIPIVDEQFLRAAKPDYVVILPWNLRGEVTQQLEYIRHWGGQFVTAVPELAIH